MKFYIQIILLLCAIPLTAQQNRYTKGAENGYAWNAMGNRLLLFDDSKQNYLSGILSRYGLMQEKYPEIEKFSCRTDINKMLKEGKSDEISLDDMVAAIDKFYRNPENRIIPIIFAYCYCIKELSGLSKEEMNNYRKALLEFSLD